MSCSNPLLARRTNSGAIKFLNRDIWKISEAEKYFGKQNVFFVPCGKCSSCKLSKRKEYATRCAMEAKYHEENCFITLTYDEAHCPDKLIKRDLTDFIKSVRNKHIKVRYFGCGEYGSSTLRPHYHIILFGYKPNDLKLIGDSKSEFPLFNSEIISNIWKKGLITVQEFSPATAGYVAGYVNKKLDDDSGFLIMSKKPGLGYQYIIDHQFDFMEYNKVNDDLGSLKIVRPPRYFDRIAEKLGLDNTMMKQKRLEALSLATAGEAYVAGCEREALFKRYREQADLKLSKLRRGL